MSNSEKEPLLSNQHTQRIAADSEVSTITCSPSFKSLLSKPFQCLPQLYKQRSDKYDESEDTPIEYADDDEVLPDLPYVTNPITLRKSSKTTGEKLTAVRKLMKRYGIGVYIVPSEDEHQSEDTALADKRREYLSEFTGSAGLCIITLDDAEALSGEAALSTDGRYFLQAEKQLDPKFWRLLKQGAAGYPSWYEYSIRSAIKSKFSNVISCDPRLISVAIGDYFERASRIQYMNKFEFRPLLHPNLVDEVWGDEKPTRSLTPAYVYSLEFAGVHTNDKLKNVREVLQNSAKANHLLVTALDDIAWLFNLRADDDIPFAPVFFSYAIITLDAVTLYVKKVKIDTPEITQYFSTIENLTIKDYDDFYDDLGALRVTTANSELSLCLPSKGNTNYALLSSIPQSIAKQRIVFNSVVSNIKIFKNLVELFNAKIAQYKDSLVFIVFSSWLEHTLLHTSKTVSEYEAAQKIYYIRSKLPNFKGLSYQTISSTGPNAAIIHYAPTEEENDIIDPTKLYLIDSGSQFLEGTTDITRTYKFGHEGLTPEYVKYYTLVLKGHLAVAMAKFPPHSTATGTILDAYARQPLWNEGRDFNHGTGHGVGSFGLVHEGPLYILTTGGGASNLDLFQPGGIVTDEPGYYVDGEYGIRIESELEIMECHPSLGKTRQGENFLGFSYLTKVPFCRKLIDPKYLTRVEINWVNEFHRSIRADFGEKLLEMGDYRAYRWLYRETAPI